MITDKPSDTDTNEELNNTADDTDLSTDAGVDPMMEAQQMMDSLADKPEVCEALYSMLQTKYSGEGENADSKTTAKPSSYPPKMMDTEGMPS